MIHLPNKTEQEIESFLNRVVAEWAKEIKQFYEFAIILNDRHIGGVSISFDKQTGELGWIIHSSYQGKGYAAEAAKAVMRFAIENLKTKKFLFSDR